MGKDGHLEYHLCEEDAVSLGPENQVSRLSLIAHAFFLFEDPETHGQQFKNGSRDETSGSSLRSEQISKAARSPIGPVAASCGS